MPIHTGFDHLKRITTRIIKQKGSHTTLEPSINERVELGNLFPNNHQPIRKVGNPTSNAQIIAKLTCCKKDNPDSTSEPPKPSTPWELQLTNTVAALHSAILVLQGQSETLTQRLDVLHASLLPVKESLQTTAKKLNISKAEGQTPEPQSAIKAPLSAYSTRMLSGRLW